MIGVFDSGVGGISVLNQLIQDLGQYDYVYLGDSARTPYGNKSAQTIYTYTSQAVDFLFSLGAQIIILACNTASAKALPLLKEKNKNILGVIEPTAQAAAQISKKGRIGVIGTRATVEAKIFSHQLKKINPDFQVFERATPLLVPLVEEGWIRRPETRKIIRYYLKPLKQQRIDTLILGCTHYPFLLKPIKEIIGRQTAVVAAPEAMAQELAKYLQKHPEVKEKISKNQKRIFYTTDDPSRFKVLANRLVQKKLVEKIEKVKLG